MRLADRHGKPLSQVLDYPAWELSYWAAWMAREPTDGQRVEFSIANFFSKWLSANSKKGARVPEARDLILPDYWSQKAEQAHQASAALDVKAIVSEFARAGAIVKKRDDYL